MKLLTGHSERKLDKVSIGGTVFLIDRDRHELRQQADKNNCIPFDKLRACQGEKGIEVVFDKLTKNLYNGYVGVEGLPLMTERIFLNSSMIEKIQKEQQPKLTRRINADSTRQWNRPDENKQNFKKRRSISRGL